MVPTENHFLGHFKMVTKSGLGTRLRVANVHQQYQVMCIFLGGCLTMCKHQSDCKTE